MSPIDEPMMPLVEPTVPQPMLVLLQVILVLPPVMLLVILVLPPMMLLVPPVQLVPLVPGPREMAQPEVLRPLALGLAPLVLVVMIRPIQQVVTICLPTSRASLRPLSWNL